MGCGGPDDLPDPVERQPGTVPVPGAASVPSAPDPHRDDPTDGRAAYPGTVGPVAVPVDTVVETSIP
jgi:hypothetical protein